MRRRAADYRTCAAALGAAALLISFLSAPAKAQSTALELSPECAAPGAKIYSLAPLKKIKAALKDRRPIRVFAFGSSSTAGAGASSDDHTYPARLEHALERGFPRVDFRVVNFGKSGELAEQTSKRIFAAIAEGKPDLIIWQVGTNDALSQVGLDSFAQTVERTIRHLRNEAVDALLLDQQFTADLANNARYRLFVGAVQRIARASRVPLVKRYDAMGYLAKANGGERHYLASDRFHQNDLGYRCMAEHAARTIALSVAAD